METISLFSGVLLFSVLCLLPEVRAQNLPSTHDTTQRCHQSQHGSQCRNSSHPLDSTSEPMASCVDCKNKCIRSLDTKDIIENKFGVIALWKHSLKKASHMACVPSILTQCISGSPCLLKKKT